MTHIELAVGEARASIALAGAELARWSVGGTPLIWEPEPAIWSGTAPILFPVVGWTRGGRVRVEGRAYPLGLHGFARDMPFSQSATTSGRDCARARLTLVSSARTRALYPFDFWLGAQFALFGSALSIGLSVKNRDARPMPYACGLHPGFRWPFAGGARTDYAISFAAQETPEVPVISPDGLFGAGRRRLAFDGRRLPLSPELFASEALCFLDARSRSLALEGPDGAAIRVDVSNFPHVALWSKPAAAFLCVESWTGYGDPVDFEGELSVKPSMRMLAPGAVAHHVARYSFTGPTSPQAGPPRK